MKTLHINDKRTFLSIICNACINYHIMRGCLINADIPMDAAIYSCQQFKTIEFLENNGCILFFDYHIMRGSLIKLNISSKVMILL